MFFAVEWIIRSALLSGFWFLLSGKTDAGHLSIGIGSSAAIAWLSVSSAPQRIRLLSVLTISFRLIRYGIWLMQRICLAALHVTRLVLSPSMPIHPRIFRHDTPLKRDWEKVIFANSITLTPGTITADLSGDTLTIHEIDDPSAGDIVEGTMEGEIQKIFRGIT